MIRKFHFIVPGTTVMEAMQLMIREQISCLPVLKDGKLCGIVTEKDMERVWKKMKGESE
ncbi:MAG: CBS domain-containing protein [Bacteroidetes bacterium]|nr:CBS domain-containing protein [Bacteroidota bacterium]